MNVKDTFFSNFFENDLNMYYSVIGNDGKIYYVIYPNCDIELITSRIFDYLSVKVCVASQKENALNCLGLTKIDNRIEKKKEFKKIRLR